VVDFTIRPIFNVSETPVTLSGNPAGGTFSGIGVSPADSTFNPATAGIRIDLPITYTYRDTNLCANSVTKTVDIVYSDATFTSLRLNNVYCYDGGTDEIKVVSVSGISAGTFTGGGVTQLDDSTFVFDPVIAGKGSKTVRYDYSNMVGTPFTITTSLIVDSIGAVDFVGLKDEYCVSEGMAMINAIAPPGGTSTWTGPAQGFFPADRNSILQPGTAGVGNYEINYIYTSPNNICQSEVTKSFVIHPLPVLDFAVRELYNVDEPPRTITGSPLGGKFTGVGITFLDPIYQFDPSIPGVRNNVPITYEYTDSNTCWNSVTKSTEVVAVNAFFNGWNANNIYCYDQGQDIITVTTVDGITPGTGQFMGSDGFIKVSDDTAIFDPVLAGPGLHELSYTYDNLLGAPFTIYKNIRVDSIGPVYFTGLQEEYCMNEPRLNVNPQYPLLARGFPTGGSHDWSGLSQGLVENGEEASIQTKVIGAGDHTITYTFTSQYGCTRDTSESFVIHALPTVSFAVREKFDLQETKIPLTGSPLGGYFSGKGTAVNAQDSLFIPNAVGVNPEYDIVYTYTDLNGCTNYDTNTVEVFDYKVKFNGINTASGKNIYCYDGGIDIVTATSTTGDGIVSGTYSGPGIYVQYNDTLEFDPAAAGFNNGLDHTIYYNYVNEFGVPNVDSFKVAVDSIYPVSIGNLKAEYCVDEPVQNPFPSVNLTAENIPGGGSHAWSGLAAGLTQNGNKASIRTDQVGPGTHYLTYTYTSSYNCMRDTTQSFIIHPRPNVYITDTLRTKYDIAEISAPLMGYPLGGTFSGNKGAVVAEDSTFHPYLVGVNPEYNIVYRSFIKHTAATCWNYDTVTVEVYDFTVEIGNLRKVGTNNVFCYDSGQVTIWAFTTDVLGMIDKGYFEGKGIQNIGDSLAVFDPVVAGAGAHSVTYNYVNNYRSPNKHNFTIIVDSVSHDLRIADLDAEYCISVDPVKDINHAYEVTAENYQTEAGGSHAWIGLTAGLIPNAQKATIRPYEIGTQMGTGTHDLTYTFTSRFGCDRSYTQSFEIHDLPVVTITDTLRVKYDKEETSAPLLGYPLGGTFSGIKGAVFAEDSTFHPNLVGINPEYNIVYQSFVTHPGVTCYNYDTTTVEVLDFTVGFEGLRTVGTENVYCYDGGVDTIWARTTDALGRIDSGYFSGPGIIKNFADSMAIFDPVAAGNGEKKYFFTYKNNYRSENTQEFFISVDSINDIYIDNLAAEYCVNDPVYNVNPSYSNILAKNYPLGGSHLWSGLTKGLIQNGEEATIQTAVIGTGTHQLTYTFTSQYNCKRGTTESFVIHGLPVVTIDPAIRTKYDIAETTIPLKGEPAGGEFTSEGNAVNRFTNNFDPSIVKVNPAYEIWYQSFETHPAVTCFNYDTLTVEVYDVTVGIGGLRKVGGVNTYCYDGGIDTIWAYTTDGKGRITSGTFTGPGIIKNFADSFAIFDPVAAGSGEHDITFTYTNIFGSPNNVNQFQIEVDSVGIVAFTGPWVLDELCTDEAAVSLTASPEQGTNGSFIQSGYVIGSQFNPGKANLGLNKVKYTVYHSSSDCRITDSTEIRVNGLPSFSIGILDSCRLTNDDTTHFFNNSVSIDGIQSHLWSFGDIRSLEANTSTMAVPVHMYTGPGTKTITYTPVTTKGCDTTVTITVDVGSKPNPDFRWESDCYGESVPTSFRNESSVEALDEISNITTYKWYIEDQLYTSKDAAHQFGTPAEYDVKLIVQTQYGCGDSITKAITVRPTISIVNPVESVDHYFEDFENGKMGWDREPKTGPINSWDFGTPYGMRLNSAYSGQNAWFTHMAGNNPAESSYILGPCFDFKGMDRPMIKIKMRRDTETDREGAVLQAETNNFGWTRIGVSDGENWYNSFTIAANPGGQSFGWTGSNSTWEQVSHNLDDLIGFSYVRLRVAFAADGNGIVSGNEGIAFDDIWIGERSKKVLLEHFTNAGNAASQQADAVINEIVAANDWDAISLQYHTHFPNQDPMNQQNPADLGARALYYGISNVPLTLLNGGTQENLKFDYDASSLAEGDILVEALKDPIFQIKDLTVNIVGNSLEVDVQVEALHAIPNKEITLHVVAYEKQMTFNSLTYVNVVKKMLPDAGGNRFMRAWQVGDQESRHLTWIMQNVADPSLVRVAVFLQDETTREVFQSETSDTATAHVIPSVGPLSDVTELNFILYPNPAEDMFNILFEQPLTERTKLEMFNYLGTQVRELQLEPGIDRYMIETGDLVKGVYFIRLKRDGLVMGYSRLVIMD
jgi:hypothetical protein